MKIKLNVDLSRFKKDQIVEFERLRYHDQVYFLRRIEDAKIDNCVEVIEEIPVKEQEQKPATKKKASEKEAK